MRKLVLLAAFLLVSSCARVPVTGRRQLSFIPAGQMQELSFNNYKAFLDTSKVVRSGAQVDMVRRCGKRIQQAVEKYMADNNLASQLEGFQWEFNLVESPQVNAWCMPGGKVVFYTGILPLTQDETGMAVVMGHEVAHAIAKHGDERMSQGLVANGLLQAGQLVLSSKPTLTNQLLMQAVGGGAQIGMLKFSRDQELEADNIGLTFMAMAGYDPRQAPVFWQRMAAKKGGAAPPEFLSTHPSDQRRIADIERLLPEALKYYKN